MIVLNRLKELLEYNSETGEWVWIKTRPGVKKGKKAGGLCDGYTVIRIDGILYKSSILAWLYMTGELPSNDVDHKDLNRSNDRWENLRIATRKQNSYNKTFYRNNKLKTKGVIFRKDTQKYQAYIWDNGKNKSLGCFLTLKEAKEARKKAALMLHNEFFRI